MNKAERERTARYRISLLHTGIGQFVLSDILVGPCRFFGRIDAYDSMSHTELFIRQQVGREILSACGVFPGIDQELKPQEFVAKLAQGIEERKAKKEKR